MLLGARGLSALVTFGLAGFAAGAALRQIILATRRQGWRGFVGRTNGGMIVHLGVVMIAVAFAASSSYSTQREVRLSPGDTAHIAGHRITYLGTQDPVEKASFKKKARLRIDGGQIYAPAIQRFPNATQQVGTPSVKSTLTEDIYLAVLELPRDSGRHDPAAVAGRAARHLVVDRRRRHRLRIAPGRVPRSSPKSDRGRVGTGRRRAPAAGPPPPEREPEPEPAGVG